MLLSSFHYIVLVSVEREANFMNKKAVKIVEELSDSLNTFSPEYFCSAFAEHLTRNIHRTLQQSCMNLFLECCSEWAKQGEAGFYDPRNEATVLLATQIIEITNNHKLPMI